MWSGLEAGRIPGTEQLCELYEKEGAESTTFCFMIFIGLNKPLESPQANLVLFLPCYVDLASTRSSTAWCWNYSLRVAEEVCGVGPKPPPDVAGPGHSTCRGPDGGVPQGWRNPAFGPPPLSHHLSLSLSLE